MILLVAQSSKAQVFYAYPTALPVDVMRITVGPYLAAGDHDLYRMAGFGRWGIASYLDLGVEFLGESADGSGRFGMGVDMKLSLLPTTRTVPFDLSASTGVGFITDEDVSIVQFPFGGIISVPLEMESGRDITPYLGVYLLVVTTKIDTPTLNTSDTDVDAELRPGLSVSIREDVDGFAAFHFGRDALFSLGLVFKL